MQPAIALDSQNPSAKHPDANQPTSAFDPKRRAEADTLPAGAFDPRRQAEANTLPAGAPPAGPAPAPDSQERQRQHGEGATQVIVEEKMPFKEQVKAWAKVHRGTVSLHLPIDLSTIDPLSRSSGIMSRRSSVRRSWPERYPHNDNHKSVANKP